MRTLAKTLTGLLVVAFFLTAASSARADEYNFTFTAGSDTATGTITTGTFSGGYADVTDITGTFNGSPITGILTGDVLYSAYPYLDSDGIEFLVGSQLVNIYFDTYYLEQCYTVSCSGSLTPGTFTLAPVTSTSVPEPGTILLLGSGLLMLLALVRLKRLAQPV